jgi:hypothetical protein
MKTALDENGKALPAIDVPAMLRCNFRVNGLDIVSRLAGSSHRFKLKGVSIEVHLPKAPPKKDVGSIPEHEPIFCHKWRSKTKTPIEYCVQSVTVYVALPQPLTIPEAALERVSSEFYSERKQEQLNRLLKENQAIAVDGLAIWLRTLRWKALHGSIGQMEINRTAEPRGGYLVHADTRRRFFSGPITFVVTGTKPITKRVWNACGNALQDGRTPPLWLDFLFEGQHRIVSRDLHGGIVCLAIACELLIRALVMRPTNRRFLRLLKRMKVSIILDQWKTIGPTATRLNAAMDHGKLRRLFKLRNDIMHNGAVQTLSDAECRDLGKAVRAFIIAGNSLGERVS